MIVTVHRSSNVIPFAIFYCDGIDTSANEMIIFCEGQQIQIYDYDYYYVYDDNDDYMVKLIKDFVTKLDT